MTESEAATETQSITNEEDDEELPAIRMPVLDKAYEEVTRITESYAW